MLPERYRTLLIEELRQLIEEVGVDKVLEDATEMKMSPGDSFIEIMRVNDNSGRIYQQFAANRKEVCTIIHGMLGLT